MESYKKEIAVLHEKNIQSAVNEKTASLKAHLETIKQDNIRLHQEAKSNKTNYVKIIAAFLLALIIGFILAKLV